jgi:hypothetical protein
MKNTVVVSYLVVWASIVGAQRPDNFPVEANPNNSNFEVYSQKNGVVRRASMDAISKYISPRVEAVAIAYTPTTNGNPYADWRKFVVDPNGDVYFIDADGDGMLITPASAASGGTVTSVGLALPGIFTVSGSPVTSSGTLTGALATQSANTIFAGPTTGAAAAPTFRSMVTADIGNGIVTLNKLAQSGATTGQTIRWSGSEWVPNGTNLYDVVTTSQTVSSQYNQVLVDTLTAGITLNLPACNAANDGVRFEVVKGGPDTYAVNLEPAGSEIFTDGSATKSIYNQGTVVVCTCQWSGSVGRWFYISM